MKTPIYSLAPIMVLTSSLSTSWDSFFALVSGFEWLHGRPETVEVRILPAGGSFDEAFLADARVQIERFLDGKGIRQALSGIYAHFNG